MSSSFQLVGLDPAPFAPLFELSEPELRRHGARRVTVDAHPGVPCRISMEDAGVGESVLLLPYVHQPADSPYRASGPIYVRQNVQKSTLPPGEVNAYVTRRLISVRAYDAEHMLWRAEVVEGAELAAKLERIFQDSTPAYVHLHNAKHGCFFCRVERVELPA